MCLVPVCVGSLRLEGGGVFEGSVTFWFDLVGLDDPSLDQGLQLRVGNLPRKHVCNEHIFETNCCINSHMFPDFVN